MAKKRGFYSEDGYLFLEQPSGSFSDGDMTYDEPHFTPPRDPDGADDGYAGKRVDLSDGCDGEPAGGYLYDDIDLNRPDLAERIASVREALQNLQPTEESQPGLSPP